MNKLNPSGEYYVYLVTGLVIKVKMLTRYDESYTVLINDSEVPVKLAANAIVSAARCQDESEVQLTLEQAKRALGVPTDADKLFSDNQSPVTTQRSGKASKRA